MKRLKSTLDLIATVLVVIAAGLFIWRQLAPGRSTARRPPMEDATGPIPVELATIARGSGQVALENELPGLTTISTMEPFASASDGGVGARSLRVDSARTAPRVNTAIAVPRNTNSPGAPTR